MDAPGKEHHHGPKPPVVVPTAAPLRELDADDFWHALMVVIAPLPAVKQHEVDMILDAFMDVAVRGTQPDFKTAYRKRFARN